MLFLLDSLSMMYTHKRAHTHTHVNARGWSGVHPRFIWDMFNWWVLTAAHPANWITHPAAMEHVPNEIIGPWANDGIHQHWLKSHSALFLGQDVVSWSGPLTGTHLEKMDTARSCLVVVCAAAEPDCWGLVSASATGLVAMTMLQHRKGLESTKIRNIWVPAADA